ncbi:hypothetical protein OQ496_12920 [Acetobacter suratthaniensis]|uniref:HNH nuclease domain-containing protein n=1 Tax=Acetobacter suratthaniensis TaxID=1502841 RepID=A0ABS3LPR4_9PROT|nr:hypothetical protein [Acetobacter suratthaniensis]MBO1329363.1 hypothetical protein [Acetobacter suratthaniensis]MCX2567355.1 hypothetical protein [Acetobacter suratthaniensis]
MIKLKRSAAPVELTEETVEKLTAQYKETNVAVWNKPYIKQSILSMSHCKCAYCETKLDEESKYMEVEHFRCKTAFPDLVVVWSNLLPSCKRCNGRKSDYNVDTEGMIIDPTLNQPQEHFYFKDSRLRWKTDLGRRTSDVLYLNDSDRLVKVRHEITCATCEAIEKIRHMLENYICEKRTTFKRNNITRSVEKLLNQGLPNTQFSALVSTVISEDDNYIWIKENLVTLGLWNDELCALDQCIKKIALHRIPASVSSAVGECSVV